MRSAFPRPALPTNLKEKDSIFDLRFCVLVSPFLTNHFEAYLHFQEAPGRSKFRFTAPVLDSKSA